MNLKNTLEREVKLRTAPGFRLPDYPGHNLPRRVFTSTYFDTKKYALGHLGITLRRRIERNKTKWQLKLPRGSSRLELEVPGKPGHIPSEFRDLLFALFREEEVIPIGKLRTDRQVFQVHQNGKTLAEISQDSIALLDGHHINRRFFETEIELIDGDDKDLFHIKTRLIQAGAFEGDPRPKVFQALDLDLPDPSPVVDPSAPPVEHLKAILKRQVRAILIHDPGTRLGRDPEELHQMRVATRRFRALLRTGHHFLDPEWMTLLRQEIGWLGGILGIVRDYDVLLADLQHEMESLDQEDQTIFQKLLTKLDSQREAARTSMLDALRSPRYLMILKQLEHAAYFPESVSTQITLKEISANEFKKLRRCVRKWDKNISNEDVHRIRIQAKRARYAAELAERSIGKPASHFIRRIKNFQNLLGSHQDAVITEQRLRELLHSFKSVEAGFPAGQIVERLRMRREKVRNHFSACWNKVKKQGKDAWKG